MSLKVQEFLRNGGTLEKLDSIYAISAKRHLIYPNLVLLKYNQIDSNFNDLLVRQCRGLILDEKDDWNVVSYSFDKFANYGEGYADEIDWGVAEVLEKADGSLTVLYNYDNKWHVQTSGMPDASGSLGNSTSKSFADVFWLTWNKMGLQLPTDTTKCWIFEMMLPPEMHRIVVKHDQPKLALIGVRDRITFEEHKPCQFAGQYPTVKSFPLQSMQDVINTFSSMNPLAQEGYVILGGKNGGSFKRVKVKHPGYVNIHHMKNETGPKSMVEIVRSGEVPEVIAHFPEFKEEFDKISIAYNKLVGQITADYDRLKDIPIQKDFALEAVKTTCSGALFSIRGKKTKNIKQYLAEMNIDNLIKLLGI